MKNEIELRNPCARGISPVWDKDSKVLIIGSMTSIDGLEKGFYYGSARNQLWEILDYCFNLNTDSIQSFSYLKNCLKSNHKATIHGEISYEESEENKRSIRNEFKKLMNKFHIAMCDVYMECYSLKNSSLDSSIIKHNLDAPIKDNKELLTQIIKNSKINLVLTNSREVEHVFKSFNIKGDYNVFYVPSPSPAYRKISLDEKKKIWKQIIHSKSYEI